VAISFLRKLARGRGAETAAAPAARGLGETRATRPGLTTDGKVVYAVGDIHGRSDLLEAMIARVRDDAAALPEIAPVHLIFLGDYIDRGRDSRGVIDRLIEIGAYPGFETTFLKGNHEASLLAFLADPDANPGWLDQGAAQTLASYGVEAGPGAAFDKRRDLSRRMAEALPPAHRRFLDQLHLTEVVGDYLFVHAGVRPGIPLIDQTEADLLSIREPFLSAETLGVDKVVVHGHAPASSIVQTETRIGVDTGAWTSGRLTAVRIIGPECTALPA
jgi:serine/threonine protein phosphatase 1